MPAFPTDIEIAQAARLVPIARVAADGLGLAEDDILPYGRYAAKLTLEAYERLRTGPQGRLILVTSINPTPAGEGKTTTSVGLADGLRRIGARASLCLREPSMGPVFGMKGGACGGGYAQVVPMEDINLHFTGDFSAVAQAHNLAAALLDNHLQWDNALGIDPRRVHWRRVMDMNDRALRRIVVGMGGPTNGIVREDGFEIVPASEVMAILCLATSHADLKARLGSITLAETKDKTPILARDLKIEGAMAAILRQALLPNIVQTLEGTPAFVHGGPFANIAHGCNSVLATRAALATSDYVVTEAGFGADLGAEKFFNIKCRLSGLRPAAAVVVVTLRALKMHGGLSVAEAKSVADVAALERGFANLRHHLRALAAFGVPTVVALNAFAGDSAAENERFEALIAAEGVAMAPARHFAEGASGAEGLARIVVEAAAPGAAALAFTYDDAVSLIGKIRAIATGVYGARDVDVPDAVARRLAGFEAAGFGALPVCVAKTQYSLSADPAAKGVPRDFILPVEDVRLHSGAGFVVALTGSVLTMPGLPRTPAALGIDLDAAGRISGLA